MRRDPTIPIAPPVPKKPQIRSMLRFDLTTHKFLVEWARRERRSLHNLLNLIIDQAIEVELEKRKERETEKIRYLPE